jgi:hypothetical protein
MIPDTLCPECHGEYELRSVTPQKLRKRCVECDHEWSEEREPPIHVGQWVAS